MSGSKTIRLSSNTTWREKTPAGLSDKFPNFKKSYRMGRDVVPSKVAQCSDGSTRTTNPSGWPKR